MSTTSRTGFAGDVWGGLAAMLVALPSAIAFGVTIFAAVGPAYAAQGALAGMLGATALGLVASMLGGTPRLITAPCAPAAAVLSATAIEAIQRGMPAESVLLLLAVVALGAGLLQVLFGAVGLGRLIKYMPYPVVSGYLSGVGLIIIIAQVPKLLGAPKALHFWGALVTPSAWRWESVVVGLATIATMVLAPRVTKRVPAAILGIATGVITYLALGFVDASLWRSTDNPLVVGPLGGGASFVDGFTGRFGALRELKLDQLAAALTPALTLAVLLSIDTLKTCVVLDALTRGRHNSNRELLAQGLGNLTSTLVGGIPGAGTMGATLVNMSSGGTSRRSGLVEGVAALGAFLLLPALVAWVPIAALAGILIVVGARMFDRASLHLLKNKSTVLDFVVIVVVVAVAETVSLIAASGVGVALAIVLFIREQIGGAVVRRITHGNQMFSKQVRLDEERAILEQRGGETAIVELQGSLFFGTADQLYSGLETEIGRCRTLILDLRRVQSLDFTAAHMLERIEDSLRERGAQLIFSNLPRQVPSGQDMQQYFDHVGLTRREHAARAFDSLDAALESVEDQLLAAENARHRSAEALHLRDMALFRGRSDATLAALEACMEQRSLRSGETLFQRNDQGDAMFLVRRGAVRILLRHAGGAQHHLATFRRGDFVGEMAFLDQAPRSADAVAVSDTELYVLSRARFDVLAEQHRKLAQQLIEGIAHALAMRLRNANAELRALQES